MNVSLYNGISVPRIGIGPGGMGYRANQMPMRYSMSFPARAWRKFVANPWRKYYLNPRQREMYVESIASAFKTGFRLLDYSAAYGGGREINDAIKRAGLKRSDIFLTGRISNRAQFGGAEAVRREIDAVLKGYETDYVDALMFHWPVTGHYEESWKVICEAYEKGLTKSVGVANCHQHHLERLMQVGMKPMLDQFEVHPLFTQKALIKFCQDNGIVVESYSAIARYDDRLMKLPALNRVAEAHGKSPVQVVLRWHIQQGLIPIIRSLNADRQKENFNVFDFELTKDEMNVIDGFNINARIRFDPDNCDFSIL